MKQQNFMRDFADKSFIMGILARDTITPPQFAGQANRNRIRADLLKRRLRMKVERLAK